jgi:hypothetical protein
VIRNLGNVVDYIDVVVDCLAIRSHSVRLRVEKRVLLSLIRVIPSTSRLLSSVRLAGRVGHQALISRRVEINIVLKPRIHLELA